MTFDELLKQMVQTSRNKPTPILYGGDLQDNTTLSLKEEDYMKKRVPAPPPSLFRENGATVTDRDDRRFMKIQPQVPANPELEALNDYFNQRRVELFARTSQNLVVSETIRKQAEQAATAVVRDEMDRRAGIRRAVLERTGMTPGQIQEQVVQESLAGINPRTMDMREQQIQDAVALYYNINNIPQPVTTPQANPIPATTPSGTVPPPEDELQRTEAELLPADQEPASTEIANELPGEQTLPKPAPEEEMAAEPQIASPSYPTNEVIMAMNKAQLIRLVYGDPPIRINPGIANIYNVPTTDKQDGERAARQTFRDKVNKPQVDVYMLRQAVIDAIGQSRGGAGANRSRVLAEPSAAPIDMEEVD